MLTLRMRRDPMGLTLIKRAKELESRVYAARAYDDIVDLRRRRSRRKSR